MIQLIVTDQAGNVTDAVPMQTGQDPVAYCVQVISELASQLNIEAGELAADVYSTLANGGDT